MNIHNFIDLTQKHTGETGPKSISESTEQAEPGKADFSQDIMRRLVEARNAEPAQDFAQLRGFPLAN